MHEEKIPLQIYGQTYEVLGDPNDALYYHSLAEHVENKMKEAERSSNIISTQRIAILAAMIIADELFTLRDKKEDSSKDSDKKIKNLIQMLEGAMTGTKTLAAEAGARGSAHSVSEPKKESQAEPLELQLETA